MIISRRIPFIGFPSKTTAFKFGRVPNVYGILQMDRSRKYTPDIVEQAVRHAKLQSNHYHHHTKTDFLQDGCPSRCPTINGKSILHFPYICIMFSSFILKNCEVTV